MNDLNGTALTGVQTEALAWPARAERVVVTDDQSYSLAGEVLKGIKALRAKIAEVFGPHIERAHQAHKALLAEKAKADLPLTEAETIIKQKLLAWTEQQERVRRMEEERLREQAREQEAERKFREAAAAERDGDVQEAAALMQEAIETRAPVVVLASSTPTIAGISYRDTWKWRVTNPLLIPREYLQIDEKKIGAIVRAMKRETSIPGVEVYPERVAAASGKAQS